MDDRQNKEEEEHVLHAAYEILRKRAKKEEHIKATAPNSYPYDLLFYYEQQGEKLLIFEEKTVDGSEYLLHVKGGGHSVVKFRIGNRRQLNRFIRKQLYKLGYSAVRVGKKGMGSKFYVPD